MRRAVLLVCIAVAARAHADGALLRIATVAPDRTAWAREFRAFGYDVERRTEGRVRVKWYWGSIAGGDLEVGNRIRRGQLEGSMSGGPLCMDVMPSMRVFEFPGLLQNAAEAKYVLNQLSASLAAEAQQAGFTLLGASPVGVAVYLGSRPVASMAELRETRLWVWDAEAVLAALLRAMGLTVVTAPVDRAIHEFDSGKTDAFWAVPTAMLAFQWSTEARHLVDIRGDYLFGCLLVSNRTFYLLRPDDQRYLRGAAAQLADRFDEVSRQQEQALLRKAFPQQGVTVVEPSEKFRAEFMAAANAARDRLGPSLVPKELIQRVQGMLADYRAEHEVSRP